MAMIACKECGNEISDKAENCPHCGIKVEKERAFNPGFLYIVIAVSILIAWAALTDEDKSQSLATPSNPENKTEIGGGETQQNTERQTEQKAVEKPEPQKPVSFWRYSAITDSMTDEEIYRAINTSNNSVNFDFPYGGSQKATMILRTHPRYGKDVVFKIERGQLLCRSNGCDVLVKFGDSQAERFKAFGAKDGSSDVLFIQNYHGFVGKMLDVDQVKISAEVYQEGNPAFGFDVMNFEVDKYLPDEAG